MRMRMEEFFAQTILDAAKGYDEEVEEKNSEETSGEAVNQDVNAEEEGASEPEHEEAEHEPAELDVQKAVVEELAADKAKLEEKVEKLQRELDDLKKSSSSGAELNKENESLKSSLESAKAEVDALKIQVAELKSKLAAEQERHFDEQSRNPNALALLDREVELPDRFPGETRDHVLEVVKEARDKAEADGRIRRAQLLEGVLVANEPSGNLAKKRAALEKFFNDNGNILSGPVLEELSKYNIAHKNGDEYLLPSEILTRMY